MQLRTLFSGSLLIASVSGALAQQGPGVASIPSPPATALPRETPYKIAVSDGQLRELRQKLNSVRFPGELEGAGWLYGSPLADIQRLTKRWKTTFLPNWRKLEAKLNNEIPQFTRNIKVEGHGTMSIHYVHQKSNTTNAVPLLFVHGWPGSFLEARKISPLLSQLGPSYPSFHVVALSLPGFGFSDAARKPGFGLEKYAEVGHKLMLSLGYNEYVVQGGDWGSVISREIAQKYGPQFCKAWHTNMPTAPEPAPGTPLPPYTPKELEGLERTRWWTEKSNGYFIEQSTQPQTLAYSLADSPVGLLGWIYEKLVTWTDGYPWTDDEVLTWISIYWFSKTGPAASLTIYYEVISTRPDVFSSQANSPIPFGYSYFPKELVVLPRSWHNSTNLVFESEHEKGGHFAAHEVPELLVGDLRKMFGRGGPAFEVVPGKSGYAT